MQRCPKCGYRDRVDWPAMLWAVAFYFLFVVFLVATDPIPKGYRLLGVPYRLMWAPAFFLFLAGTIWKSLRSIKDRNDYLKSNPSVTERVKAHVRPSPSQ